MITYTLAYNLLYKAIYNKDIEGIYEDYELLSNVIQS